MNVREVVTSPITVHNLEALCSILVPHDFEVINSYTNFFFAFSVMSQ